jgi:hypothetical protein
MVVGINGPRLIVQAWLLRVASYFVWFFAEKIFAGISDYIRELVKRRAEAKQNKEASKAFKDIVNDPTKTREERKNAEDDFINS